MRSGSRFSCAIGCAEAKDIESCEIDESCEVTESREGSESGEAVESCEVTESREIDESSKAVESAETNICVPRLACLGRGSQEYIGFAEQEKSESLSARE